MNTLNTSLPVFFIAYKKRDENGNITVIRINDKEYYTVKQKAESDYNMLIDQKHFKKTDIEIIKLWFCVKKNEQSN